MDININRGSLVAGAYLFSKAPVIGRWLCKERSDFDYKVFSVCRTIRDRARESAGNHLWQKMCNVIDKICIISFYVICLLGFFHPSSYKDTKQFFFKCLIWQFVVDFFQTAFSSRSVDQEIQREEEVRRTQNLVNRVQGVMDNAQQIINHLEAASNVPVVATENPVDLCDLKKCTVIPEFLNEDFVFSKYCCPISSLPIRDPVGDPTTESSTTILYDRLHIVRWLSSNSTSPVTRRPLTVEQLVPKPLLKELIDQRLHSYSVAFEKTMQEVNLEPIDDAMQRAVSLENPGFGV